MQIKTPKNWRKGQTIFNFLEWLKEKGYSSHISNPNGVMADPYYIKDEELDKLYKEFMEQYK